MAMLRPTKNTAQLIETWKQRGPEDRLTAAAMWVFSYSKNSPGWMLLSSLEKTGEQEIVTQVLTEGQARTIMIKSPVPLSHGLAL